MLNESGANPGTMGSGDGEVIGSVRMTDKDLKIAHAKKEQKRYTSWKKQRSEREKEKIEAFRERGEAAKHFGEDCGSTGMPGNWGGGTSADGMSFRMLTDRISKRRKIINKLKDLNKKEDINMAISPVAELYNRTILSEEEQVKRGRGRPPKDPVAFAAKQAAKAKAMGHNDHEAGDDNEADKNIVMQMKKASGAAEVHAHLDKPTIEKPAPKQFHEVEYANGQKQRVSPRIANKWLEKHASLKPEGKLQMQLHSQKSHANLMQAIGEEVDDLEEASNMPNMARGVKCKSCGEGHKVSGKVMMDGYHAACKDVSKKAEGYKNVSEAFGTAKDVRDRNSSLIGKTWKKIDCKDCGYKTEAVEAVAKVTDKCSNCKSPNIVKEEMIEEGRIADKLKDKNIKDKEVGGAKSKGAVHNYFKNKYKKSNGKIEKNED
jgi:predicted Zn-ribbon and HTH transcriptional regulator